MNQDERRFDFRSLAYILKTSGHHPSLNTFYQIVTLLDISVDQFFYPDRQNSESYCCQHIDVLLNSMNEKEFVVIEATAGGIKKARETEGSRKIYIPISQAQDLCREIGEPSEISKVYLKINGKNNLENAKKLLSGI